MRRVIALLLIAFGLAACGTTRRAYLPPPKARRWSPQEEMTWRRSPSGTAGCTPSRSRSRRRAPVRHAVLRLLPRGARRRYRAFDAALAGREHLVCYAVKANSNLAVLDVFARLGAGFDIVSGGELVRVSRPAATRQGRVLRRRQVGAPRSARRSPPASSASTSSRPGSSSASTRRGERRDAGAGRGPREPRRRSEDASVHLDRPQAEQVRRRRRGGARAVPCARAVAGISRSSASTSTSARSSPKSRRSSTRSPPRSRWSTRWPEGIALQHLDLGGGLGIRYGRRAPADPRRVRARRAARPLAGSGLTICCSSRAACSSATPACWSRASCTEARRAETSRSSTRR